MENEQVAKPFSVVVWPDGGICVVATKWMDKSKESIVYPTKTKCPTRLVMSLVDAQEDWKKFNVEFLHSYKTFNLVRKAATLAAEDQPIDSNIETDYAKPRKRQLPARFIQTSDDESDLEPETIYTERQVAGGSHRKMQRMENEERENCQNVSQKNSIPAPVINIREQLAVLKTHISNSKKGLKSKESHSNIKKKVLAVREKKLNKIDNKMSSRKSPLKEILDNYQKNSDTESATSAADVSDTLQHANLHTFNLFKSPLVNDNMTSDSERLSIMQTSSESLFLPHDHLEDRKKQKEQKKLCQSSDEHSDNDMRKEHRFAQGSDYNESSLKNTVKSSLQNSDDFSRKKGRNIESTDITSEVFDNIVKVQEEIRIKLDHLEVKLNRILMKLFPEEVKLKRPRGIPAFPLRTEEEWENLEKILVNDDAFLYVVDVFTAKIKNQESEVAAVQSLLPKIITNSLSRSISWGGTQKTKIAFDKSKTYEIIQATILQRFGKTTNLQKPEDYVKRWFSTSAQRVV